MRRLQRRLRLVFAGAAIWAMAIVPASAAGLSRTNRSTAEPPPVATNTPAPAPQAPAEAQTSQAPARAHIVAASRETLIATDGLYDAQLGPVVVAPGTAERPQTDATAVPGPVAGTDLPQATETNTPSSGRLILRPGSSVSPSTPAAETLSSVGVIATLPEAVSPAPAATDGNVWTAQGRQARIQSTPTTTTVSTTAPEVVVQTPATTTRATIGPARVTVDVPATSTSTQTVVQPTVTPQAPAQTPTTWPVGAQAAVTTPAPSGEVFMVDAASAAQMALDNSIDLDITAASVREAEAQLRQAFGLDDFRADISATYGRRGPIATASFPAGDGEDPEEIELGDPVIDTQSLTVVKPLWTNGQIRRAQGVALRALETRKLSRGVVERALDLQARQGCYEVLRMSKLALVAQDRTNAVAAHTELSKKLLAEGVVARFEVVQAETALAQAQGDVIATQTAVEQMKAGLRRILTLPQDSAIDVSIGQPPTLPDGSQSDLVEMAWRNRPEVHASQAAVTLAEASLKLAFASRNVSVSLTGGLTRSIASFGSEPTSWQVAISATKPILDAKQEKSEVMQAKAQLDGAKLELEKQRQDIALEVAQAYVALTDARERLRVAEAGLIEAKESLRISKVRYQNGLALGVEVLDAQTALTAADAELVNSTYNLYASIATLRSSVGLWTGNE